MKFKTQWNGFPSTTGEKNYSPSLTVPDQSMPISEIMSRFARGLPVEGAKVTFYDEENDLPDLKNMDLAERQEYIEMAKDEIEAIKEKHKQQRSDEDARLKKEREKAFKKEAADKADDKKDTDKVDENTNLS